MKKTNQHGFGFVVVLLAIVVIGVVAFGTVRVMGNNKTSLADGTTVLSKAKVPAKVTNAAELQKASQALDETPVDSGVNPDQLDNDLNALL
ncbi:MAG: hypothetical protein QFB87_02890 [Patescibacteria group bacterium]|nr:hypothetical protein [Patescibacteria group bacterium]